MPGAFEYLDPTAPKPDPDVLMSGLPHRSPYAHVPTTGEVSNVSRPTDTFRDRIAQGVYDASPLSLGPAAYGVGQMAGEAIQDMDPTQGAFAGVNAMFLGLPGMRNLQKAGKVAPGARGSEEALQKAQGAWAQGADPRKVWDETGWADGSQFGQYADGRPPQPVAWHSMPDIEFKNYDPGIQRGSFAARTEGTEDLLTAYPELEGMAWESRINSTLNPDADEFINRVSIVPGSDGDVFKKKMSITARDPEEARAYLMHETQHAADDNMKWSDMDAPAIPGTEAEQIWDALRTDTLEAVRSYPPGQSAPIELQNIMGSSASAGDSASYFAGYANNPIEVKARMAAKTYNFGSPEEIKNGVFPGDIDPWAPEAFHPVERPYRSLNSKVGNPVEWRHYKKP